VIRMELIQPTAEQKLKIYGEFSTDEEKLGRDVKTLIEWTEKQAYLPNIYDEVWLRNFLLRCKNSVERAKERLDTYYTVRANMPEIYSDRDPSCKEIEDVFDTLTCIPLPRLTPESSRVTIFKAFDPSKSDDVKPDDVIKAIYMSGDIRVKTDLCADDVIIFDMSGFTMSMVPLLLLNIRKFIVLGTEALPMRYKSFYVLNVVPGVDTLITACKNLLKKELAQRIKILKSVDELYKDIPKEVLPSDFGGTELPLIELRDKWLETLRRNKGWFAAENDVKTDLSRKPNYVPEKAFGFGTEGSFRQISVD